MEPSLAVRNPCVAADRTTLEAWYQIGTITHLVFSLDGPNKNPSPPTGKTPWNDPERERVRASASQLRPDGGIKGMAGIVSLEEAVLAHPRQPASWRQRESLDLRSDQHHAQEDWREVSETQEWLFKGHKPLLLKGDSRKGWNLKCPWVCSWKRAEGLMRSRKKAERKKAFSGGLILGGILVSYRKKRGQRRKKARVGEVWGGKMNESFD